jgi:hypothetical protein
MSERQPETIRVKLTADDYAGFNLYHGRWQLAGLFLFYWCVFVILVHWSGGLGETRNMAVLIPAGFLLSACMLAFQLWRIRVRTNKIFENDKLSKLEQNILLTQEGIQHSTGETVVHVPWGDVFKVLETSKALIIYLARNKVVMLPKRDLTDLKEVKMTFSRHLPSAKLKLKS